MPIKAKNFIIGKAVPSENKEDVKTPTTEAVRVFPKSLSEIVRSSQKVKEPELEPASIVTPIKEDTRRNRLKKIKNKIEDRKISYTSAKNVVINKEKIFYKDSPYTRELIDNQN